MQELSSSAYARFPGLPAPSCLPIRIVPSGLGEAKLGFPIVGCLLTSLLLHLCCPLLVVVVVVVVGGGGGGGGGGAGGPIGQLLVALELFVGKEVEDEDWFVHFSLRASSPAPAFGSSFSLLQPDSLCVARRIGSWQVCLT